MTAAIDGLRSSLALAQSYAQALVEGTWDLKAAADVLEELPSTMLSARDARRLTTTEAAEACGITQTTYWRIENNKVDPSLSSVIAILRWLGGDPS